MHWLNSLKKHWQYRLFALCLAFFCWYLVSGSEKVDTWMEIPLEFVELPDDYVIRSGLRNRIQVRVRGASGIIRGLDTQHLAYKANLSSLHIGSNTILLTQKNIPLNTSLEIIEIAPPRLELEVDQIVSKTMPIVVDWKGKMPRDMFLKETWAKPSQVTLTGGNMLLSKMEKVLTKPIELSEDLPRIWQTPTGLAIPDELETDLADIQAFFRFAPKTRTLWVKRPVTVIEPQGFALSVEPSFVRLKLELPLTLMRQEDWRETIIPQIKTGARPAVGTHQQTYKIVLPEDTDLLEAKPIKLTVKVHEKTSKESP